ncbi:metal-dependent transcriptional regulator, partial [Cyclobacteriaceae bacterium]|nr:metal-dependent transcriptional regulator [Cyclobacteriaceae bacterium]
TLTDLGKNAALTVIRKHRLWETFLVDKLKYSWDEVHYIAEQLEHIKSEDLVNRLDDFLGNPKHDPHGDPIPDKNGVINLKQATLLHNLDKNQYGVVVGVDDSSNLFLKYLNRLQISLGSKIEVIEKIEFDQSIEIKINNKDAVTISADVAQNIFLEA